MSAKFCKRCGNRIPKKVPNTNIKTKQSRNICYDCVPVKSPHNTPHTSPDNAPNKRTARKLERHRRKEVLVKMLGGCCSKCGYNKSLAALSFHHINPKTKCFDISHNGSLMKDWDELVEEAKKCEILCLNCHAIFHNDQQDS